MRGSILARSVATLVLAAALAPAEAARAQAPVIIGFTPASGPPGTLVKIIGANLGDLSTVQFGSEPSPGFWLVTPNHVKAYVPEAGETGPILVVTGSGVAVSPASFVVIRPSVVAAGLFLAPPRPNPSPGPVIWTFTLPRAARAVLSIFDLRGRRVGLLLDAELPAGLHERSWDGRDARGRAAPPGIYVARLDVEGARLTRRAALIR